MPKLLQIRSSTRIDLGRKRSNLEDYVTFFEPSNMQQLLASGRIYLVGDGVGGAYGGERASHYASEKVKYEYYRLSSEILDPRERLQTAMLLANRDIYEYAESKHFRRMATTLVAAVILGDKLIVANVGDSRAYLVRAGEAVQITTDHTTAGEMVKSGLMTEEEASRSRAKNHLTRSIGGDKDVHVDIFPEIQLFPGDKVLLCSDGLTRYASKEDLVKLTISASQEEATRGMVDFANQHGGVDNIAVILIDVGQEVSSVELKAAQPGEEMPSKVDLELMHILDTQQNAGLLRPSGLASWFKPKWRAGDRLTSPLTQDAYRRVKLQSKGRQYRKLENQRLLIMWAVALSSVMIVGVLVVAAFQNLLSGAANELSLLASPSRGSLITESAQAASITPIPPNATFTVTSTPDTGATETLQGKIAGEVGKGATEKAMTATASAAVQATNTLMISPIPPVVASEAVTVPTPKPTPGSFVCVVQLKEGEFLTSVLGYVGQGGLWRAGDIYFQYGICTNTGDEWQCSKREPISMNGTIYYTFKGQWVEIPGVSESECKNNYSGYWAKWVKKGQGQ